MRQFLAFLLSVLPADPVARAVALGQLRHVLTIAGTLLVSCGVFTADQVGPLVEALMQLGGGALVIGAMFASRRSKVASAPAAPLAAPPATPPAEISGLRFSNTAGFTIVSGPDGGGNGSGTGPVSGTLGALLALALLPMLAACDSLTRAVVPLVATLAPATACALDIAGAVQAPGETHQSDTEKAVASAVLLTTDRAPCAAPR